jgi:hypothetical protein
MARDLPSTEAWFDFSDWSYWAGKAWASKMNSSSELRPYLNPEGQLEVAKGYQSVGLGLDYGTHIEYTPRVEPITGFDMVPAQDPVYWEKALEEQKAELKKLLNQNTQNPRTKAQISSLKELIKEGEKSLASTNLATTRQEAISQARKGSPELNALASGIERDTRETFHNRYKLEELRQTNILKQGLEVESPGARPIYTPEEKALAAELQAKIKASTSMDGSIHQRLIKWNAAMKEIGLDAAKWGGSKGGYLLEGAGSAPMLGDIHRYMKGGFDTATGHTYYPSEVTNVEGVNRPTEVVSQMARLHPDNAKQNPDVTDEERRKFNPAWFKEADEKNAKAQKEFLQRTGAKGPVPMETPAPRKTAVINLTSGDFFTT